jgi:hypothetical protein
MICSIKVMIRFLSVHLFQKVTLIFSTSKLPIMCRAAYTYHSVRHSVVERRGTSDSLVGKTSLAATNGTPPARPSAGGGGRTGYPPLVEGTRLSVPRSPHVNGQRTALQRLDQVETVFAK